MERTVIGASVNPYRAFYEARLCSRVFINSSYNSAPVSFQAHDKARAVGRTGLCLGITTYEMMDEIALRRKRRSDAWIQDLADRSSERRICSIG